MIYSYTIQFHLNTIGYLGKKFHEQVSNTSHWIPVIKDWTHNPSLPGKIISFIYR